MAVREKALEVSVSCVVHLRLSSIRFDSHGSASIDQIRDEARCRQSRFRLFTLVHVVSRVTLF